MTRRLRSLHTPKPASTTPHGGDRAFFARRFGLLLGAALAVQVGCSSEDGPADTGTGDSGVHPDAVVIDEPDTGVMPRDGGLRDAAPAPDAAMYCTTNDEVRVGGVEVAVGAASAQTVAGGGRPDILCQRPTPGTFNDPMFVRGCLEVIGGAPSPAELAALDIAVFPATDLAGAPVDPTFDPDTGADRQPNERVETTFDIDTNVPASACASQVQVEIGFDAPSANALLTEREYTIRVRTASAAGSIWATHYLTGTIGRNDNISRIGGGECSTQNCYFRVNLTLLRQSTLTAFVNGAGAAIPGATNLDDGLGAGYAVLELDDCNGNRMTHAVAGAAPAPLADGYVSGSMLDTAAVDSTADALYVALGFTGMTANTTAGQEVTIAVGADRSGACTEEFAGTPITVYPDAITVLQISREHALRSR